MKRTEQILISFTLLSLVAAPAGAAGLGPCSAFTDDATYVTSTLIMQLEHRRVPLRVPIEYFEDAWDRVDGVETTAQLFSVDINDFSPVSRPQTSQRNKAGRHDYMWFLVGDQLSTRQIALLWVYSFQVSPPDILPAGKDGPAGLSLLETPASTDASKAEQDIFVDYAPNGRDVATAIKCNSPDAPGILVPICEQVFTTGKVDVDVSYSRFYLAKWRTIQADITNFLTCASKP